MAAARYIGLMSGTSADGMDAVIAEIDSGVFKSVVTAHHLPYPITLRARLIALGRDAQAAVTLPELAALDVEIAQHSVTLIAQLLDRAARKPSEIVAIGSHGQTVFHDPRKLRSSLQLGDPNHIAALIGIQVVADFRRMDIALGGEGAPLVPAFHAAVFGSEQNTAVVNIGGIANVTLLPARRDVAVIGYDCGPGNALMDEWAQRHTGRAYDHGGALAARGTIIPALLRQWLDEPYFAAPAPKSTGRALFNMQWAEQRALSPLTQAAVEDVQATFCELTAQTIAMAIPASYARVLVCGGGVFNKALMARLATLLPAARLESTANAGLPPQWVEASAFAWLAHQRLRGLPGNLPSVTGASRPAVLGGVFG